MSALGVALGCFRCKEGKCRSYNCGSVVLIKFCFEGTWIVSLFTNHSTSPNVEVTGHMQIRYCDVNSKVAFLMGQG